MRQAHFPWLSRDRVFQPHGTFQNEWVDIVRYDSVSSFTHWMESKERQALPRSSSRSSKACMRIG